MDSHFDHHTHSSQNIKWAFFLNLAFTIVELVGGIMTNSLAILSDALHDLGDSLSLGLSWYFQNLSKKGRSIDFTYGYGRFSLLGAIINSVVLIVGSVLILSTAIPELFNPQHPDARGMAFLSILGIIVNGAAVLKLRQGSSMNERVVALHLLEDVLGWLAVLIGSVVMMNYDIPIIDPILSILIASLVLFNVYKNLKKSLLIVLQAKPQNIDEHAIKASLQTIEEVNDLHDFHVWTLDGEYHILTLHVNLEKNYTLSDQLKIKEAIRQKLHKKSIQHITIEFDEKGALNDHVD